MVLEAIDEEHAKLLAGSESLLELEVLAKLTLDTYWKINLFSAAPHKLPWLLTFLDQCQSEDLAMVLPKCSKMWQQKLFASQPVMEVWRADSIASCTLQWQGDLLILCSWELQAKAVATVKQEWQGQALLRVVRGQEWKLGLVVELEQEWQVEGVLGEAREKVARLVAGMTDRSRVAGVLACDSMEEWKVELLEKSDIEDWKFKMLLEVQEEEKAFMIEKSRSQVIAVMICEATESWKLNALDEAARLGFWLAAIVSEVEEEWQARLVLLGGRDKTEQWRLQQLPTITHENMAANFLFRSSYSSTVPRWKFKLGLEVARAEDPLAQEKAELMFLDSTPRWKAEMAARCCEAWRLAQLPRVTCKAVGELFMCAAEEWRAVLLAPEPQWRAELVAAARQEWKAVLMVQHGRKEEQWRLTLVAPLDTEWQVKMVFVAPQVWKAEMIAQLSPDQERRGRELLECSSENFAREVMAGLTDIYYT